MAHRTAHRRNLAAPPQPHPHPHPSSSMDSTLSPTPFTATPSPQHHHRHRHRHHPTPKPDLITNPSKPSSLLNHFSRLNFNHRQSNHPHPLPAYIDTHLQAKAMTASVIVDSSKFSLLKPNTHNAKLAPKLEKESKSAKKTSKEKPEESTAELEKRKLHGGLKSEKMDSNGGIDSGSLFEDVKKEKWRNPVEDHDMKKRSSVSLVLSSGGRRRSFCGSQVDLGDVFAINGVKVVSADMPPFMQIHAVDCARKTFDSMEKFTSKTLALTLKKEFDGVYGPAWHCIVGTGFGSFVTHSVGGFLYFSMDQKLYILLFKTTVQKAD